jgi:transglutaminase-like putative cysteine protease
LTRILDTMSHTLPTALSVTHETAYRYASPVTLSRQLLHLTPRELPWQQLLSHRITVQPAVSESATGRDYFGNPVAHAVVTTPHKALSIIAESRVLVHERVIDIAGRNSSDATRLAAAIAVPRGAALLDAARFAFDSPHVAFEPAAQAYGGQSLTPGRPLLEALLDLNTRVHRDFEFDPAATSVSTPLAEVLQHRRGVCQDFAHLMIGCLRAFGLAARYVSGYILTEPPEGQARLVGSDASHAWVSVYCPDPAGGGLDWIDLDPTNDCLAGPGHVTLGWGRDFSDVTPTRGVILGGGEQELFVGVTVAPAGAAGLAAAAHATSSDALSLAGLTDHPQSQSQQAGEPHGQPANGGTSGGHRQSQ